MPVLVNDVLKHKGLVHSAVLQPVPCLGWGPELMLFSELHKALSQNASVQLAEWLHYCNGAVIGQVCSITSFEDWHDQQCFPRLEN